MKTIEERLEEVETVAAALVLLSTMAMASAVGDDAAPLIRTVAEKSPDLSDNVRKVLRAIAAAAEGKKE